MLWKPSRLELPARARGTPAIGPRSNEGIRNTGPEARLRYFSLLKLQDHWLGLQQDHWLGLQGGDGCTAYMF